MPAMRCPDQQHTMAAMKNPITHSWIRMAGTSGRCRAVRRRQQDRKVAEQVQQHAQREPAAEAERPAFPAEQVIDVNTRGSGRRVAPVDEAEVVREVLPSAGWRAPGS
jgi:hypothetical protein